VTKPIRLLLADDHTLVRAGMRTLLGTLSDVEVVAEASDGREALRLVEQHRPDVVLMDVTMPELNGLEATARVAKDFPETRVIMLSMHASEEYVLQALNAGAAGYLLKESDIAELELAIKAVARGESYLSPAVSKHVIANYVRRTGGENNGPANEPDLLTPRQREVLRLIADGRSTKEIARILNVSVKTVETHRMQLMERLGIHDVAGLVRYALRVGLTKAE
jgi:DNA-binding NarL/FixJ family response regulator